MHFGKFTIYSLKIYTFIYYILHINRLESLQIKGLKPVKKIKPIITMDRIQEISPVDADLAEKMKAQVSLPNEIQAESQRIDIRIRRDKSDGSKIILLKFTP